MSKRITIRSTIKPSSNGRNVRIRTTVNNGHCTRSTTKTVRVK